MSGAMSMMLAAALAHACAAASVAPHARPLTAFAAPGPAPMLRRGIETGRCVSAPPRVALAGTRALATRTLLPALVRPGRAAAAGGLRMVGGQVGEPRVFTETDTSGEHGFKKVIMELEIEGEIMRIETGEVGRLAAGAVMVKQGTTVVYSTACGDLWLDKEEVIEDFVPMSVHYQERSSAAGKTPGGYIKRDGRPSDDEVLVSRIIDRTLRPIFPAGFCREVQILTTVLGYDKQHAPDPLAMVASAAALLASPIPYTKPVAGVAVGMDADGKFVVNPKREVLKNSRLNLFVSGTESSVLMIEGASDFLTEEEMAEAIEVGMKVVKQLCIGLQQFSDKTLEVRGQTKIMQLVRTVDDSLFAEFEEKLSEQMDAACRTGKTSKSDVYSAVFGLEKVAKKMFLGENPTPGREIDIKNTFKRFAAERMRLLAKNEGLRVDGRTLEQVRPISVRMEPLPAECVHGSALFTRGETQALCTVTLGDKGSRKRQDTLDGEESKRFYLQYTFPPNSVGECGRIGAVGRREVGHGNLAERGILAVLPSEEEFPYTIRLESLITESCGSSSMASVCGGSLALFNAGVPLKRAVAGVAMGLLLPDALKRGVSSSLDDEAVILTDILGLEDALGTMDFKVCGDAKGITAFQLDIKCEGLSTSLLRKALMQAKSGRLHMLYHMLKASPKPKTQMAPSVPKMIKLSIPQSAIGKVIGPGGATIRALIEEFSLTNVDIEETNGEGIVTITSLSKASNEACEDKVRFLVQEANNFSPVGGGIGGGSRGSGPRVADPEVGKVYEGCPIVGVHPFGCFVQLYDGKEGLVHVSELSTKRIDSVESLFKVGETMDVKVLALKDAKGKLRLSRKAVLIEKDDPDADKDLVPTPAIPVENIFSDVSSE
eukprot:CAMPEP_0180124878 /NCGR_PEP_ID=MMETSP0986-20121125/4885_1 /TAXON_ID=697907 /ORGANISM="non described non described, Strain CCMP2293" /LENGTH=885 /DNA_ID=CAMNT_0022064245 /DNA_START=180 /DNA_END=2837 /DNA_ORIENTATION=-